MSDNTVLLLTRVEDGKQDPFLGSDTDSRRHPYPFSNLAFHFSKIGAKLTEFKDLSNQALRNVTTLHLLNQHKWKSN